MRYITAPLKTLGSVSKSLTMFFLVTKLLESFVINGIKIKDLDKQKEQKNGKWKWIW